MPRNRGGFYGSYETYDRDFGAGGGLGRYDTGYRTQPGGGGYRNQYSGGGWTGYRDEDRGGTYNGFGGRERMAFEPRHEYDRDMADQLREGWNDLKRGVRRAFGGGGGGYDTGWRGHDRWRNEGAAGRWDNEPGWHGETGRGFGGGYELGGYESGGYENQGYQSGRGWGGENRFGYGGGMGRGGYGGGRFGGGWSGEGAGRGWRGGRESGYDEGNRGNIGDRFENRGYGGDYQW